VEKVFVAKRVQRKLYATEKAIDAALVEASEMIAEMVRSGEELKLATSMTDASVGKIAQALAALSQARSALVGAHGELAQLRDDIGIRTRMDPLHKNTEMAAAQAFSEVA
jgi:hypothetical protein